MRDLQPIAATRWTGEDVAVLYRRVQKTCLPYLPVLHSPTEDLAFFTGVVEKQDVFVAATDDALLGFCAFEPGWINHLYLDPTVHRQGVGARLLAQARSAQDDVQLRAFQRNEEALAFYTAHGFVEMERTDGSGNEEGEPDVRLRWTRAEAGRAA